MLGPPLQAALQVLRGQWQEVVPLVAKGTKQEPVAGFELLVGEPGSAGDEDGQLHHLLVRS